MQTYILDEELNLAPVKTSGELCIGGVGLARGYLNRPDLTGEKFVPNPYSHQPGDRLYRTGDLVRYRHDGKIEFLGRADQQVKFRGYRIEPGEVEAVLLEHSDVKEAFVVAEIVSGGEKRLLGYAVRKNGGGNGVEFREYLRSRLPEYMVPWAIVEMDELPRTPSGKIDRRRLPAPAEADLIGERQYEAPNSPVEEILCQIWADVLNVKRVGASDDFFDLGGHSLLATKVVSRIRKVFRVGPAKADF